MEIFLTGAAAAAAGAAAAFLNYRLTVFLMKRGGAGQCLPGPGFFHREGAAVFADGGTGRRCDRADRLLDGPASDTGEKDRAGRRGALR